MPNYLQMGYYETGTASIIQGQTVVTGQGTAWSQIVRPADDFGKHVGMPIPIASVDSDTQITLAYPWPGPTQAAAPYRVTFTPYHVAYRQALQEIGQLLSSGNVSALAGLAGGADKLPFFDGTGTMDQTVLSAFMRTLLDDADAAAGRNTLELGSSATQDASAFATAAQGVKADAAFPASEVGILSGFRNKIINGDLTGTIPGFPIKQRNHATPLTPGIGVYGYDRWKGHADGLEQICEWLEAGEYTLSWTGGGSGRLDGGSLQPSPIKATVSAGNVSVVVPTTAGRVSLVKGDATAEADPFSPRHPQQELALCQRYYEISSGNMSWTQPGSAATVLQRLTVPYKVEKRGSTAVSVTATSGSSALTAVSRTHFIVGSSANQQQENFFSWVADAEL